MCSVLIQPNNKTPSSELETLLKLSGRIVSNSSNTALSNSSDFKWTTPASLNDATSSTIQTRNTEPTFSLANGSRTDTFNGLQRQPISSALQRKILQANSQFTDCGTARSLQNAKPLPPLSVPVSTSGFGAVGKSDHRIEQDRLRQLEETIRHQKSVINRLTVQTEQLNKELKSAQEMVSAHKLTEKEARMEADRRVNLLATLTNESARKDAMLRQLDAALGRLTAGWQKREQQRQAEMNELRNSEQALIRELDENRQRLDTVRTECDDQLKQQRTEWTETMAELKTECNRLQSQLRSAESDALELRNRFKQLENVIAQKDLELSTVRDQCMQITQKGNRLQSEKERVEMTFKQHITEAQHTLKRESKLRKQELKTLQAQMKQIVENGSKEQEELQRKLNEYYEDQLRKFSAERDKQFQDELMRLQESARNELREASDRYRTELEQLRVNAQAELARHMSDADNRLESERKRVEWAEKQVERWRLSAREAEEARSTLASRLNELLQSRCMEAMQMLHPKPVEGLCRTRLTTSSEQINSTCGNRTDAYRLGVVSANPSPRPQFVSQTTMQLNYPVGQFASEPIKPQSGLSCRCSPKPNVSDEELSCATVVDRSEPTRTKENTDTWRVFSDSSEEANDSSSSQDPICV